MQSQKVLIVRRDDLLKRFADIDANKITPEHVRSDAVVDPQGWVTSDWASHHLVVFIDSDPDLSTTVLKNRYGTKGVVIPGMAAVLQK